MKALKTIAALLLSAVCTGVAFAQASVVYGPPIVVAQHRVVVREVRPAPVVVQAQAPVRQRRFVMPPNGTVYPRGAQPQYNAPPPAVQRAPRMTPEQRHALRRQINEANKGLYSQSRTRTLPPQQ